MDDDRKKKIAEEKIQKDSFWIKVLIITIVIVWCSLIAGNWAGHYVADTRILNKRSLASDERNLPGERAKGWKKVVGLDNQGRISQDTRQEEPGPDLNVKDFRNIDDPIPGIDDQSIRTLGKGEDDSSAGDKGLPPSLPDKLKVSESPGSYVTEGDPDSIKKETPVEDLKGKPVIEKTATPSPTQAAASSPTPTLSPSPSPAKQKESTEKDKSKDGDKAKDSSKDKDSAKKPSDSGSYDLQMGSFSSQQNANKMLDDLKSKGYSAHIEKVKDGDKEYFKVKMEENHNSREAAQSRAGKLKEDGFDAIIISR
jgi:cell division septation protein DedD